MYDEDYQLKKSAEEITEIALKMGLDFIPMRYEVCPSDIIYTFGAYGMPTRFHHWSFGKDYYKMKTQFDFGLSKIYELVINSDPCYAFLLDTNTLIQNKMIIAHVLGHSDFFKNNVYFSLTNRKMVDKMALYADQIGEMEFKYGVKTVEHFLDAVLSIHEHIDPRATFRNGNKQGVTPFPLDSDNVEEKDLLLFIAKNSKNLEEWQQQIIYIMREEMLYFWPQIETKIMNEGWASYWHVQIMRELDLTPSESIEFAKLHSSVLQPDPRGINPYYLGYKMFEYLDKKHGREFIFEVRELDNDVSFLRNYLNEELIKEMDLYLFGQSGKEWRVTNTEWEQTKMTLINQRTNGGFPYLVVKDGDYQKNGELYIEHKYEGIEMDIKYVEKTLPYVYLMWGRPVHLETTLNERKALYTCKDGVKIDRRFI